MTFSLPAAARPAAAGRAAGRSRAPLVARALAQPTSKARPATAASPSPAVPTARAAAHALAESAAAAAAALLDDPPLDELKAMLLDSLYGTERGLTASSEVRAEINELITQLEARSPRVDLDDAASSSTASSLDGVWTLAYTANSELTPLLALGRLPGCSVGPITQTISGGTATNAVPLTGPLASTTLEASAAVEVRSPKRLALRFERGRVAPLSPGLAAGVDLPSRLSVLGADVDLSPLKAALAPAADAAAAAASALASAASSLPPLDFAIPSALGPVPLPSSETWLLTTFLDGDLRIARGDGGSVFVMTREVEAGAMEGE